MSVSEESRCELCLRRGPPSRQRIAWDIGELLIGLRPHPCCHLDSAPPPALALLHRSRMVHRLHHAFLRKLESDGLLPRRILALFMDRRRRLRHGRHCNLLRRQPFTPCITPARPLQWVKTFGGYTIWALFQQLLASGILPRAPATSSFPIQTSRQCSPPPSSRLPICPTQSSLRSRSIWGLTACLALHPLAQCVPACHRARHLRDLRSHHDSRINSAQHARWPWLPSIPSASGSSEPERPRSIHRGVGHRRSTHSALSSPRATIEDTRNGSHQHVAPVEVDRALIPVRQSKDDRCQQQDRRTTTPGRNASPKFIGSDLCRRLGDLHRPQQPRQQQREEQCAHRELQPHRRMRGREEILPDIPATTSIGITPDTSRVASMPPRATDSFQRYPPGNSIARPMRNPAPPAIMIAGNSSDPCGATKLHSAIDIPY